jgi:predicted ATP-grasp superfamily ATP-dependent carboligase
MIGQPVEPYAVKRDTNLVFWYGYEDLLAVRDYLRTGQLTLGQVVRSLFKPKAYAIWDWTDPVPAFAFVKMLAGKFLDKIART